MLKSLDCVSSILVLFPCYQWIPIAHYNSLPVVMIWSGMSPKGSYIESLVTNAVVFRGGASGSWGLWPHQLINPLICWADYWEVTKSVEGGTSWKGVRPWGCSLGDYILTLVPFSVCLCFLAATSWAALFWCAFLS